MHRQEGHIQVPEPLVFVKVVDLDPDGAVARDHPYQALRGRIEDIRKAIADGAVTVAAQLDSLAAAAGPGWELNEVSASFGIALGAEGGVLLTKASAQASFDVTLKFQRT